jgi:hypothetical protein
MDACHIILGRPWQFDMDAIYKGHDNVYIFMSKGQKVVLGPIKKEFSVVELKTKGKSVLLVDGEKFMDEAKKTGELFCISNWGRNRYRTSQHSSVAKTLTNRVSGNHTIRATRWDTPYAQYSAPD